MIEDYMEEKPDMNSEQLTERERRGRLLGITALASAYCVTLERAAESERDEFLYAMLHCLPRLYAEFFDLKANASDVKFGGRYYQSYVDEDYYENIRRHVEMLLGPDDTYLETFEEDMKYSDTPIAASISEGLADIFQPLYNFISVVKDTDGAELEGAYEVCREAFEEYWSQTLCNVLRPLNALIHNS